MRAYDKISLAAQARNIEAAISVLGGAQKPRKNETELIVYRMWVTVETLNRMSDRETEIRNLLTGAR